MRVYNVKQRKSAYLMGIVCGFISVILLLTFTNILQFSLSIFYAFVPISIDYGFTKAKGLKTENYLNFVGISSMILMFLGMLVIKDFRINSLVVNLLFLYFGIKHCYGKL